MSSNPPNANPAPSGSPSGSGGAPAPPMTPELRQLLEKEIGFAKLLDYVVHEPFELTFQKQLIQTYEQQLVIPLMEGTSPLGNLDAGRIRLKSLYDQLEIAKKMSAIIAEAEVVCRANKIKEPIQKKSSKISMITMTVVMVAYFVLLSLPGLAGYSQYIMIPLLLVICFLPQLLKSVLEKKWNTFKELNKGPLQEAQRANMTDVKVYIQEILNDTRQRMLQNHVPLQAVRVVLLSQEYENLTFINTQKGRSSLNYVMEFKYDPGMEPYPVPGASNAKGITTTIPKLPAGKIEDTFVLLKKTHFNDEGTLTNYEIYFPPHELYPNIENLLNNTEFNPVDGPQDIIPSFTNNTQIFCDCGESIKFVEMKYCISKDPKFPGFEFYLAIGQKCGCGKTPYVLFPSPGNKDIPADLKDLF